MQIRKQKDSRMSRVPLSKNEKPSVSRLHLLARWWHGLDAKWMDQSIEKRSPLGFLPFSLKLGCEPLSGRKESRNAKGPAFLLSLSHSDVGRDWSEIESHRRNLTLPFFILISFLTAYMDNRASPINTTIIQVKANNNQSTKQQSTLISRF